MSIKVNDIRSQGLEENAAHYKHFNCSQTLQKVTKIHQILWLGP